MENLSLYELNNIVREVIEINLTEKYWVRAELSDVRVSQKGHCFIELIEKDDLGNMIIAKARAVIMRNIYPLLRLNFEETTGQAFVAGLKVLLQVSLSFSEVYGYSLIVEDIDPKYTLGSIVQRREEIWKQLQQEGVAEMNKELPLPLLIQRIAIISSPTAAGYEDFCNQIDNNIQGFHFVYQLFPAMMQGDEVEKTMVAALEKIATEIDNWDVVVIIRGGGAVSDLNVFDSYVIANNCAQFPIPVLTGIGHERDKCILDMVANSYFKTPTAVASFLVERMQNAYSHLQDLELSLYNNMEDFLDENKKNLKQLIQRLEIISHSYVPNLISKLDYIYENIRSSMVHRLELQGIRLLTLEKGVQNMVEQRLNQENKHLQLLESVLKAYNPENILKQGYSITLKDGKVVKDISQVKPGDVLETRLKKGKIQSIVK